MNAPTQKFKAEDASILAFVLQHQFKSEKGEPLDFKNRLFLLDILTDWSPNIVWKKCSQVGGSVIFNIKALFAVSKLGLNCIYTHPSDSDVQEFVQTKTNPLLRENKDAFPGMSQDSVYLKQVGKRNLYFKGTISKTAAISTSADLVIHDEASRSDQQAMAFYQSRLKGKDNPDDYKGTWIFSNPTTEKDTLDEQWQKSDMKEWFVTCSQGHSEMLAWPESIDKQRKCYQCRVCKTELTTEQRRKGHWQKTRESLISGYHTSHLMAPWISAEEILKDSEGDQEYFYNFVLGEPYNPGDLNITRSLILDNWTPKDLSLGKEWFLGVDVGNIQHYVLGTELGVVKVGKLLKWQDLDNMMRLYKPSLVIDANPNNTMARYYVEKYEKAHMSFFMDNTNNPQTIVWWGKPGETDTPGNKQGIVYSNRNRILDQLIEHILQAKMLFSIPTDAGLKEYIDHWLTLRRIKVTNAKGIEHYEWQSTTGVDHYVFATLYYYLAQLGRGSGTFFRDEMREPALITNDNKIVSTFAEAFEEVYE